MMERFEVKYWNMNGDLMAIEVVAYDWREAQRMVEELDDTSGVEGCVGLGESTDEHGIIERTKIVLKEATQD